MLRLKVTLSLIDILYINQWVNFSSHK